MHAREIVSRFFDNALPQIHAARRGVLSAVVVAAMSGHWLSLSRLARGVVDSGSLKAAIKRVDRLIGHARIGQEAREVGAALMARLCTLQSPLVIAVDWSAVAPGGAFVELRAAVTWSGMGRGLTVYQCVYPERRLGDGKAERALLRCLRAWVPAQVPVIVVTDAGFRRPWFREVERLGWSYIGRVRRGVNLSHHNAWMTIANWFERATTKAKRWRDCTLTRHTPFACDVVLVRRPRRGRNAYRRPGHGSTPKAAREARGSAQEPWLLAHSPALRTCRPDEIVAWYSRRMQIEENFRDSKSLPFGMGQSLGRSRSASRLHALLLISTLAAFFLWHIGQLAEAEGLQRRYRATTRTTRELSIITLALLLCTLPTLPLSPQAVQTLHRRLGGRR